MEYVRLRKPRWERTTFRPAPDSPAILENSVESGPTIDIPTPAEPKPQDETSHPRPELGVTESGQMRHFAKDCPKRKPAVVQTVQVNPNDVFCTSCGQSSTFGCDL